MGRKTNEGRCPRGPRGRGRAPDPRGHLVRWLVLQQESQYPDRNHVKISAQSELCIFGNLRNSERAESEMQKHTQRERDRETDPISEGLSPLRRHGGHGPEGKPFSHLGRRSRKKKKKGGPLPLSPGGTGTPPGPSSCDDDLHQHLRHLHQHLHHLPRSIYSGPLSRNPLYPLLEHGALCFILLSNDVLPSYDV